MTFDEALFLLLVWTGVGVPILFLLEAIFRIPP